MDNLGLLHEHYKESFGLSRDAQSNRNKTFLLLNLALAISFLFVIEPASVLLIITSWLKESHGVDLGLQVGIVQVFLWLIVLYFTMKYIQLNCYIERQYKYISSLENKLTEVSGVKIDRESANYLKTYPIALDGIHIVYTWIFPILYEVAITFKILVEIKNSSWGVPIVIDCIIFLCCFALFCMYFYFLRKKKNDKG